ncbi:MAG TPA: hypothetical protein VFQ39_14045 [Longimicrobium sp.]|nr:hypothetical protein [Longimicrobium sp.]
MRILSVLPLPLLILVTACAPSGAMSKEALVDEARSVSREVEMAVAANRLARRDTTLCADTTPGTEVRWWTDDAGRVRRLEVEGGTDDHAEHIRYDYDGIGRLRLAFASFGAVNGTGEEETAVFSPTGELLSRERVRTAGPGYTFAEIIPLPAPAAWLASGECWPKPDSIL